MKLNVIFTLVFLSFYLQQSTFAHENAKKVSQLYSIDRVITHIGGDFSLTNHFGENTKLQDYRGKIIILNFGYTYCPDVCPLTLNYISSIVKKLKNESKEIQVLFVTFDPKRDTPEHLKSYLSHFDSTFIGLTGSQKEIDQVASQYKVLYQKQETDSKVGTLFAHTDLIYILDEYGRVRAMHRYTAPINKVTQQILELIDSMKQLKSSEKWKINKKGVPLVQVKYNGEDQYVDPKKWCFVHGIPHPLVP